MVCYLYIHAQCPADLDVFNLTTLKKHKNKKYKLTSLECQTSNHELDDGCIERFTIDRGNKGQ